MIKYTSFTLDNGLRIIYNHDPGTAMVAVNIIYNVGARDESPSLTGLAHLFEHLMFGGSVNIPDFDAALERAGGTSNAWTTNDFTNFYDVAPAANFETLLWLESDRMLSLAFSPKSLDVQRSVVIEEFKQTHLNRPYGDVDHRLRELIYTSHPYRYPTIGKEISHIESVTLDDVRQFFYSHYAPNNAVLAVSGNVTFDEVRRGVEKWFGPIPRRDIAPRLYAPEPVIVSPRTLTVTARVPQPLVLIAYPMAGYRQPGYIEGDIITDILALGRSSRFHRDIIMSDSLFTEADALISGSNEPGYLMLRGRITESSPEAVAHAVDTLTSQAGALREECGPHELERAVNSFESNQRFTMQHYLPRAQELAMAEMQGEDINGRIDAYRAVTTGDITAAARDILDPSHACTLIYLPEQQ